MNLIFKGNIMTTEQLIKTIIDFAQANDYEIVVMDESLKDEGEDVGFIGIDFTDKQLVL